MGAPAKTVTQQLIGLNQLPITTASEVKSGRLVWEGDVRPTVKSESYVVRIVYAPPRHPEVTVIDPELEVPDGVVLPHTFPGDRLCLYWRNQWDPSMALSRTIVAWAAEWLLNYELWRFVGEWLGGGHGEVYKTKLPPTHGGGEAPGFRDAA